MVNCYIALGSNLGNRRNYLSAAFNKIKRLKGVKPIKISRVIETPPVGMPKKQPKFLNAALKIKTSLTPIKLLKCLQRVEEELGRPSRHSRSGNRAIDLDILLYGDKVIRTRRLIIPHPRMFKRDFVIKPLSEVICD